MGGGQSIGWGGLPGKKHPCGVMIVGPCGVDGFVSRPFVLTTTSPGCAAGGGGGGFLMGRGIVGTFVSVPQSQTWPAAWTCAA